jgi:hypothetical protein
MSKGYLYIYTGTSVTLADNCRNIIVPFDNEQRLSIHVHFISITPVDSNCRNMIVHFDNEQRLSHTFTSVTLVDNCRNNNFFDYNPGLSILIPQ